MRKNVADWLRVSFSRLRGLPVAALATVVAACAADYGDGADEKSDPVVAVAVVDGAGERTSQLRPLGQSTPTQQGSRSPYRIVAANLTAGDGQTYDSGEGTRVLQALAPDLALVQELNFGANANEDIRTWVNRAFGADYSFVRESGMNIPNGIVSRYPIVESGTWRDPTLVDRSFVWARITEASGRHVFAVSVHLSTRGALRQQGAATLRRNLDANVRSDELVVVGGDFNAGSPAEASIQTLSPVVGNGGRLPADENGNRNTNRGRNKPYDQVLLCPALLSAQVPTVLGGLSFPNGLVFDTRRWSRLDSVPPAQRGDSDASQMQHMAVVRDVALDQVN